MSFEPARAAPLLVPESAPCTPEQRARLSGFLGAALAPHLAFAPAAAELSRAVPEAPSGPVLADNADAPWHDPAMPTDERMRLAQGRPIAPRMMAAMAQQDCGQCGYSCAAYANAIVLGRESRLDLCVPGGKETARPLKTLAAELAAAPPPVEATFLGRERLSLPGSSKDTCHVELDLGPSGLTYEPGDALGLYPRNDPGLVDQVIATLGASPNAVLRGRSFRDLLLEDVSIGPPPDALFELFSYLLGGPARQKARALAGGEDPDGDAAQLDLLAALLKFPGARPHPEALVDALDPLQPRLHSISSSPRATPGRVTLTVDARRWTVGRRQRLGVASTFLGERVRPGETVRVFVQRADHFRLPADPEVPIVMVGPGTGVAPFRAFLLDRQARGVRGRARLFFGHRNQSTDFFYRRELEGLRRSGHLTRLSLAWSRDGEQRFYVHDRMREVGAELWRWFAEGAHLYVCGDAERMAEDVEAALVDIVAQHGARSAEEAVAFVGGLKKAGRYHQDVY